MSGLHGLKLSDVVGVIPRECYERPTWKGLAWFARDLVLVGAVVAALIVVDSGWLLAPLWILSGLAISALFIVGHDAAHGALFKSKRLNYLVGQISMLPSLHIHEAWVFGHNRVHHGHTTREQMDYVWHPLTPQQYEQLSALGKLGHRIKWSFLGSGIYYLQEIWWNKMVRNFKPPQKVASRARRDRSIVALFAVVATGALLWAGWNSYGTVGGAAWMWIKVMVVPFVAWNYSIGFAVYVQHISPEIPWFSRRSWDKVRGRVEGTTIIHVPRPLRSFYHNIMLHVAHHVDMSIPFYGLPKANRALADAFGDSIVERRLSLRDYLRTTKHCKLFDFEHAVWCRYPGAPTVSVAGAAGTASVAPRG